MDDGGGPPGNQNHGELLDLLCPEIAAEDPDERERLQIEALRSLLDRGYNASVDRFEGKAAEVVGIMRDWLDAFSAGEFHGYEGPLFQGLAEIERDWTFVKYFVVLIECLWA